MRVRPCSPSCGCSSCRTSKCMGRDRVVPGKRHYLRPELQRRRLMKQGAFPSTRQIRRAAKKENGENGWELAPLQPQIQLNLGCGPHQILPDHINVDVVPHSGVDVVQNLFVFPWTGLEHHYGKVDKIFCSHLVEHIPHDVLTTEDYPLRGEDGFYCFFYECWKLLKPTGRMEVLVPHAPSNGAFQDPTHCRFMVETSFSYL